MCCTYQAGGMYVTVKGKQATRKEAPILVIAPHSTFLDAGIVYVTGFPSIIVRTESGNNPWLGSKTNNLIIGTIISKKKIVHLVCNLIITRDTDDGDHSIFTKL